MIEDCIHETIKMCDFETKINISKTNHHYMELLDKTSFHDELFAIAEKIVKMYINDEHYSKHNTSFTLYRMLTDGFGKHISFMFNFMKYFKLTVYSFKKNNKHFHISKYIDYQEGPNKMNILLIFDGNAIPIGKWRNDNYVFKYE